MSMSVTYVTVHGRLREETRGGVTTRYLGDTLGNVIKTTDTSGNVTSTTTYWPFGEVRTQTGTNPSPWGFCGVWGYLTDAVSRMYVRARHYRADTSRWLTVDRLWPSESAYGYCHNLPTLLIDLSGENPVCIACGLCLGLTALWLFLSCNGAEDIVECILCRILTNPWLAALVITCAVACAICLPSLAPALGRLGPVGGGLALPAAAVASGGGDPCKRRKSDKCANQLGMCQAACSTGSVTNGPSWWRCCSNYCDQNHRACVGVRNCPYSWQCGGVPPYYWIPV
mgnify:CR=1 FL=1